MQLTQEQIAYLLSRIDLFESFTPFTLRVVAQACRTLTLQNEDMLFEYGTPGSSLFIVADGQLEVFRGDRVIARISRNEYIGEMALFDPGIRSASVRAIGTTSLLEVSREVFQQYLQTEPESLCAMLRTITRRLRGVLDDTQGAYEHVNMQVHDMLNLLNVLSGAALVADALPADDDHQRYLEIILHTRDRLEVMMRDSLRKARGRPVGYTKRLTDIEALVRQCVDADLALHPDLMRIHKQIVVGQTLRPCGCNPIDLQRVVANLLINAAQAMEGQGTICIELRQQGNRTLIEVSDSGCGIAPHLLPLIFDTHFTTKRNGTGLGLSSCRMIIEDLHGGRITCRSTLGAGTTFTIDIPTALDT